MQLSSVSRAYALQSMLLAVQNTLQNEQTSTRAWPRTGVGPTSSAGSGELQVECMGPLLSVL